MTIGLSDEDRELRDSVRGWAARHATPDAIRAAVEAKTEARPSYWASFAELGMLGLHLPEEVGGAGYGILETAIVAEELGRAMVPGPFLPTAVVSATLHAAGRTSELAAFADGTLFGAVSLQPGTLTLTRSGAGVTLSGTSSLVLGGHVADVFLLAADDGGRLTFVVVDRDRLGVTDLPSHDVVRRNAEVTVDGLALTDADVLALDAQRVLDIAATLFAAEASGLADWATTTAAEYARTRRQFGRAIGQFQGVKHKVARMFAHTEQARVTAWDAARALGEDISVDEASLAAAVAAAVAVEAAFGVTKDCIQVLGGIGFTWEHDAHLYLRRMVSLRQLLGGTASWRARVAELTRDGARRHLTVDLGDLESRRGEVRADVAAIAALPEAERRVAFAESGYLAPHWPAPYGKSARAAEQILIGEELDRAGLETPNLVIGWWAVPTILEHGTPEQIERFAMPTLRGDLVWCQLFSEPGAGSDLASLRTTAEKVDGGWVLTGQKVWTSLAREADWAICLARTDRDAPKHKGITYFVVDMRSAGIRISPLREITGDALFNEVFLDGVFVPDDCVVGQVNGGWKLARTTLANERVAMSGGSSLGKAMEELLELSGRGGTDPVTEDRIGFLVGDAMVGSLLEHRTTLRQIDGQDPGPESSVRKLVGVRHRQAVAEYGLELAGLEGAVEGPLPKQFFNTRCLTIAGGTEQILLTVAAEQLLALPRG